MVNLQFQKDNAKVVVSLQHGGWGSSDEAHRKHKEETGDNVEPLIH